MRTHAELLETLAVYRQDYVYDEEIGYLVWRTGTGNNLEALFIEVRAKGRGDGRVLYRRMVEKLLGSGERPYYSVFGFVLGSNERALGFYRRMGWAVVPLGRSVYMADETVLVWIAWDDLLKELEK